jgi:hypothetical protein
MADKFQDANANTNEKNDPRKGPQEDPDAAAVSAPVTTIDTTPEQDARKGPQQDPDTEAVTAPVTTIPTSSVKPTTSPCWPETPPDHPLTQFYDAFEALVRDAQHNEVYGIELTKAHPFTTKLILQKFLRANQNDLHAAKTQLLDTLKWRREFNPTKAANETFSKTRFAGLGYVLEVAGVPESANKTDVATFNIYGAVTDKKATFGDLQGFLRWRVGLMERSVQKLNLAGAKVPIPDFGEGVDMYQGVQVHDYLQVSFFRQDPSMFALPFSTCMLGSE